MTEADSKNFASWINEVRNRLAAQTPRRLPPKDVRQAAVLVPLYVDAGQLWTLLTKRSEALPTHKGQIAFPGGSLESGETSWDGSLRETHEEIGIEPSKVLRLGQLDQTSSPSGFHVVPCVGAVPFPLETVINQDEIDEVIPIPLTAFANPAMVEERLVVVDDAERMLRIYHVGGRQIWGLTARILQDLLVRLGLESAPDPSL